MRAPLIWYPEAKPKGKHSRRHTKTHSDNPEIAIDKVEKAVAKRLRKAERNKQLWAQHVFLLK